MEKFGKFPKLWALGQKHIRDIFDSEVEITEKIDGSQFGFGKIQGELVVRSKNKYLQPDALEKMFIKGVEYVKTISELIPDNTMFYGEYLQKPKHNVLAYDKTPKNYISLFGMISEGTFITDHDILKTYADKFDIDVVPLLFKGKCDKDKVEELLNTKSYLGVVNVEGVVVKNYYKDYWLGGQYFPIMGGKYVSEKFKEVHSNNWKKEHTGKGKWETYCEQFKTPARWDKAVQHLREDGILEESPRDIGNLIKEIHRDIEEEEKENIKEVLWNLYGKDIKRVATNGFPEWYKKELMNME
jgi:hypothetical protein